MTTSNVGPWARDKLDRLQKYLQAYTTIMRKQSWCEGFFYIDAFAGPGMHEVRRDGPRLKAQNALLDVANFGQEQLEQREFLSGSPRVALDLEHPFSAYVFVEKNSDRVAQLEQLKTQYGAERRIVIRQEDCNRYLLQRVVANEKINWKQNRAVVFLDPFGMQVEWATLEALAATKAIEVFLNFPVGMAIQRLLLRNPEKFTKAQRAKLDGYFGSPDWFNVLYKKRKTLFGDETEKIDQSGEALLKWYRGRLRAAFGHVSRASLIRNTRAGHLYYLLLASPSRTGVKIADHILGAGEWI
ncbi:MAG: three-Cys-motif partner protein TcmP [Planctomycetes bacterium]|nr:three-Cys-motif partner protein TcmP [Planctomycetota bacterium]